MGKYKWAIGVLVVLLVTVVGIWKLTEEKQVFLSPEAPYLFIEKPWEKYSFPSLRQKTFIGSDIEVAGDKFYYYVDGRKISGQIFKPSGTKPEDGWPVVIMIRGYVDPAIYQTGIGTSRAAQVFAANGFITLAPDFLGFGESDMPPNNSLEERFMRPAQVLELIASVSSLPDANSEKINIWGHSNGGQIALSVLEISGKSWPTCLWAPVSKPFPYSIFYYTDEAEDNGKALRRVVAGFEAQYNADEFSIHNYYDWIKAPVQIHQGTADEPVPLKWSQALEQTLKEKDKQVELFVYQGADHNLVNGADNSSWNSAVNRCVQLY